MSISDVGEDFETFFNPTRIWLFGKPFRGLRYLPEEMGKWTGKGAVVNDRVGRKVDYTFAAAMAAKRRVEEVQDALKQFASDGKPDTADRTAWKTRLEAILAKALAQAKRAADALDESLDQDAKVPREEVWDGEFDEKYRQTNGELPIPPARLERTLRRGVYVNKDGQVVDDQGNPVAGNAPKQFSRIYSYTYEGHYYRLARPLLFLLTGDGESVRSEGFRQRNPFSAAFTGVEAREWEFSYDIRVWTVDRKDLAVCLDVEIGNYQEILLDSMLGGGGGAASSRGDVAGRGAGSFRGDMAGSFRGDMAGSFRGDMIGPHQNKVR